MEEDIDIMARWFLWAALENYAESFYELTAMAVSHDTLDAIYNKAETYMPEDAPLEDWLAAVERLEANWYE